MSATQTMQQINNIIFILHTGAFTATRQEPVVDMCNACLIDTHFYIDTYILVSEVYFKTKKTFRGGNLLHVTGLAGDGCDVM